MDTPESIKILQTSVGLGGEKTKSQKGFYKIMPLIPTWEGTPLKNH